MRILVYAISLLVAVTAQSPQPAPTGTATAIVAGQVVDARGAGVPGAFVTLNGGFERIAFQWLPRSLPDGPRRTVTTGDGRFAFFDLAPGKYGVEVSKPGFLPGAYGRKRHGGEAQSFVLADGGRNTGISVQIWEFAAIAGTVRDEAGEPVVSVRVNTLRRRVVAGRGRWERGPQDTTDDRGEYRIDSLPPGEFVVAVPSTYLALPRALVEAMGAARSGGALPANQNPMLRFSRAGILGAASILPAARHTGEWVWQSDPRGSMTVPAGDERTFVYPTTFYPGARTIAQAQPLTLASGEERASVDFDMQPVRTAPVSGVVDGPDGPVSGLAVRLLAEYQNDLSFDAGFEAAVSVTDAGGRFAFFGVPLGRYVLRATATPDTSLDVDAPGAAFRGLWAAEPVTVDDSGVANLGVTLRGGVTVSGRVVYDGSLPKPTPDMMRRLTVGLEPLDPGAPRTPLTYRGPVDAEGRWTITEVPPGRYLVLFYAFADDRRKLAGWETKGATLLGRDVATRPLALTTDVSDIVMTITDRPAILSGTARAATGDVDPDAAVLLFTAERDLWTEVGASNRRMRSVRADERGAFEIRGIPAGTYFLTAIPDADLGDWQDPPLLEALARTAVSIAIADAEKKTQDVTVRPVR